MDQPVLQVLLVEDQDQNIDNWRDAVNAHNADSEGLGFAIETHYARSLQGAQHALRTRKLDALIVDLRLERQHGVGENNDDGNELVKSVAASYPVSMIVVTGEKASADKDHFPSQVQVHSRDEGLEPVFRWLSGEKNLLLHLQGMRNTVDAETAGIFFKSIWPRWQQWMKGGPDGLVTGGLTRHVVAHVHDSLLHSAGGVTHPEETYFVPPLKKWLDTGDLVSEANGEIWIVLTPRCDLANQAKPIATVVLAKCDDISEPWKTLEGKGKAGEKEIGNLVQHEKTPRQHFLPPMQDDKGKVRGPWMVQFHNLKTLPMAQSRAELPDLRIASLAPQFVPTLVERFGAYYSRIGSPNFASD